MNYCATTRPIFKIAISVADVSSMCHCQFHFQSTQNFESHLSLKVHFLETNKVRYFRGRVTNFNQSEARKQCFLAFYWLKFETILRKYRTLQYYYLLFNERIRYLQVIMIEDPIRNYSVTNIISPLLKVICR